MNLKALPVKVVAVAVGVALVAKAVVRLAPKAQQDAHAMVLPPHVAAAPLKAHAVIVKIVPKEVLTVRHPIDSTIAMTATTTDATTVAHGATNCHVTLIPL